MPFFVDQLERLLLPNQHMTISVHIVDALFEPSLYMGVSSCRRSAVMRNNSEGGERSRGYSEKTFMSAECLWRYFQNIEDASRDVVKWLQRHSDTWFSNNQHLVSDDLNPFHTHILPHSLYSFYQWMISLLCTSRKTGRTRSIPPFTSETLYWWCKTSGLSILTATTAMAVQCWLIYAIPLVQPLLSWQVRY